MANTKKAGREIESYISEAWESNVRFSLQEVSDKVRRRLTDTPDINIKDPACRRHSIILVGEAGIGKSTVLEDLCEKIGAEYATYHHGATVVEDNHGLQVIDSATGTTKHVVADHMLPFKRSPKGGRGVFLIDEAANGSFTEHEVVLRMFVDGQCDEHKVFPGWLFVCASNPPVAKYSTVRQPDFSLEDRFLIMPIDVPNDDKLAYWSRMMPPTVYKFLLMNKMNKATQIDFISKHSSRRWSAMAYDVEKDLKAGATRAEVVKFMSVNMGSEVATAFAAYMENGDDPDKYPIGAEELLFKGNHKAIMERVERWLTAEIHTPLLGATQFDIVAYLSTKEGRDLALPDEPRKRLVKFMVAVGTKGHSDLIDDMLNCIARTPLCSKVVADIEETPLSDKMLGIMNKIAQTDSKLVPKKI